MEGCIFPLKVGRITSRGTMHHCWRIPPGPWPEVTRMKWGGN